MNDVPRILTHVPIPLLSLVPEAEPVPADLRGARARPIAEFALAVLWVPQPKPAACADY